MLYRPHGDERFPYVGKGRPRSRVSRKYLKGGEQSESQEGKSHDENSSPLRERVPALSLRFADFPLITKLPLVEDCVK